MRSGRTAQTHSENPSAAISPTINSVHDQGFMRGSCIASPRFRAITMNIGPRNAQRAWINVEH